MKEIVELVALLKKIVECDERIQSARHNILLNYIRGYKYYLYNQHNKRLQKAITERRKIQWALANKLKKCEK